MRNAAYQRVADRFKIPVEAVIDIASTDAQTLIDRSLACDIIPSNGTSPQAFEKYPLGSVRLARYGGDLENRYIDYLTQFDPQQLINAEAEQGIKRHPSYARYLQWAKDGIQPPYISVCETDRGTLQSTSRRRTLVAQELDLPIIGWLGPHNWETDLSLKYGDVLDALKLELSTEVVPSSRSAPAPAF